MKRCAMWRTPAETAAPSATRPGFVWRGLHRHLERRRAVVHLPGEGREVLGEVVERAARGRHVDEPEERRAQLGVLGGDPHRALVDRPQRMPRGRRQAVDELATDRADLGLQPRLVDRLRGRLHALNLVL